MPIFDDLPLTTLALFYLIIFAAGFAHGSLGLGFPMIATPLLALLIDLKSAILITLIPTISVNIASIIRGYGWRDSIGRFWPLSLYAMVGSSIGTMLIIETDPAPFKMLLAILIFLYLLSSWLGIFRMQWVDNQPALGMLAFGLSAGFAAGTTNVMVPILIIYTLGMGLSATVMVQTFNLCFLAGKSTQIILFSGAGMLDDRLLLSATPLTAVALTALFLGIKTKKHISTEQFRLILKVILCITAIMLIVQYLTGE